MIELWSGEGLVAVVPDSCEHDDVVPVESVVTGKILAYLCLGCDIQIPESVDRLPFYL